MTRTLYVMACGTLLAAAACGKDYQRTQTPVNCSVVDAYEFSNINNFEGASGWYYYTDLTPGGVPAPPPPGGNSDAPTVELDPPRCGSSWALKVESYGHNYWGSGFGDWQHNTTPVSGEGYEGISFWARSATAVDKTFLLSVDDDQTFNLSATAADLAALPDGGVLPPGVVRKATSLDQDLNGDGFLGPGDIAGETHLYPSGPSFPLSVCRLSPPQSIGDPSCYYGGTQAPDAVTRVPEPGECGNSFHTWITLTEDWQFYQVPWSQLVQWPCPNRAAGGIHKNVIRKFDIRMIQGSHHDFLLDDMQFYRLRASADAGM